MCYKTCYATIMQMKGKQMNAQITKTVLMGVSTTVTALMAGSAMAWVSSMPNALGGYNYTSSSGGWVTSTPNVFGGYNYTSSSGGFGSSMPNAFGGYNYSGSMFRGANGESTLFSDADITGKIDAEKIAAALTSRNVDALTSCAWDLKGLETILGKVDKKTSSKMLFAAAAQLAVEQGNADGLKAIVALEPECKKYEDQLALRGKTRGAGVGHAYCLPELVPLESENWKDALKKLKPWQSPMFDRDLVCCNFRGVSEGDAEACATMINGGRATMNPLMEAVGAVQLSKYAAVDDINAKFQPSAIFKEAVSLAILKKDVEALKRLAALYEATNFREPDFAVYIENMIAVSGKARGMSVDQESVDGRSILRLYESISHKVNLNSLCQ